MRVCITRLRPNRRRIRVVIAQISLKMRIIIIKVHADWVGIIRFMKINGIMESFEIIVCIIYHIMWHFFFWEFLPLESGPREELPNFESGSFLSLLTSSSVNPMYSTSTTFNLSNPLSLHFCFSHFWPWVNISFIVFITFHQFLYACLTHSLTQKQDRIWGPE